jgi:exonuclease 3'-5' domain-containing protein 1
VSPATVTLSLIDSETSIAELIKSIKDLPNDPPFLHFDLKGENLPEKATISFITFLVHPKDHVYLIDVYSLKSAAFTTTRNGGTTLKDILNVDYAD